jgi:predicted Zn-dependent protease
MSKARTLPTASRGEPLAAAPPAPLPRRRPFRAALFLTLALAAGLGVFLASAWEQTLRHEAYLPQLEQRAGSTPTDGRLLALLGARFMEAHEFPAAVLALHQALGDGEDGDTLWIALASASAATGDRARAIADLRLGLRARPTSAALQGALAQARSTPPDAPSYVLAAAISPRGAAPLVAEYGAGSFLNGAADWWGRRHAEQSGFSTRQAWVARHPNDPQTLRLWGLALIRNRRLPEAESLLRQAVALAPDSPAANLAYGDFLMQSGHPDKATLRYVACLKARHDWFPALMGLGRAASRSGMPSYAAVAYEQAAATDGKSVDAWVNLGRAYVDSDISANMAKAAAAFGKAAALAPKRLDFLPDYANALRLTGRMDEAEAMLRRYLAAVPGDAFCHFLLGKVLDDSNPTPAREAEAEAQTREALRLVPDVPKAEVQLGQMLLSRGRAGEAVRLLEDAMAREPSNDKTMKILARACQQTGQTRRAQQLAARSDMLSRAQQQANVLEVQITKEPLNLAARRQLAGLYHLIGAEERARQQQSMILAIQQDPKQALQHIQGFNAQLRDALPQNHLLVF